MLLTLCVADEHSPLGYLRKLFFLLIYSVNFFLFFSTPGFFERTWYNGERLGNQIGLPDLVNKNTGWGAVFKFQINNNFLAYVYPKCCMEHIYMYTKKYSLCIWSASLTRHPVFYKYKQIPRIFKHLSSSPSSLCNKWPFTDPKATMPSFLYQDHGFSLLRCFSGDKGCDLWKPSGRIQHPFQWSGFTSCPSSSFPLFHETNQVSSP